MTEIWKPIAGFEKYAVSNLGNVKSLYFTNNKVKDKRRDLILSKIDKGNGYDYVTIQQDGKRRNFYVHRLVAEAFIPNENNLPVVNHIDFDKKNNRVDNLEWVTQLENVRYSVVNMCRPKPNARLSSVGERYIRFKRNRYVLTMDKFKIYKSFLKLEDAIKYRDEVMNGAG